MRLKCIGGMADGTIIEVHPSYRDDGELVKVPAKVEFEITAFSMEDVIKNSIRSVPYHFYKIHSLHNCDKYGNKSTIKYLVPEKWDYWEALIYLFNSHNNAT